MTILGTLTLISQKKKFSRKHSFLSEEAKLSKKFFIHFKICTRKAFGQIEFLKNLCLRKISKEAPNFQLATVVLSLKVPVWGLVITIQYGNILTLVTKSLDESLGQSLGMIVRNSTGSDPMRDFFLALQDSF